MAGNDAVIGVSVIGGVSQQTTMSMSRFETHLNGVANAGKNAAAAFRQMSLAGGFAEGAMFGSINKFAAFAKTTAEFEERMARAAALMGPANANLARMRDTVMTMSGMEHGPNALADAFLELSRAGIENGQALRDMKTVADLATVAQIGLGEAANSTATIMLAWAGPLDTSTKLLSQLANVANATQYSIKGLMSQMRYATPASIQFGQSYTDMLASLGMLAPVVGTVRSGRVHNQMLQNLGNPKSLALMSKVLGRNVTGEVNSGKALDVLFDVAGSLQSKHGIVKGAQKGREMFSGIGASGMSAYFRVAERGVTGADGKVLYGREALQHYRNMADTGSGLGSADDIRASPGMVMKRLKVDWEKFLIGVGEPFVALLVELEKPIQSLLKAGQAFGKSEWAKATMVISALPLVGAAVTMLRAIGGRTSAAVTGLFGIGGAGLGGGINPGTLVPLSAAQKLHAFRTGNTPAGFNAASGMYAYQPSSLHNLPFIGGALGGLADTGGRMFPGMQSPRSYLTDPVRNPRVRAEQEALNAKRLQVMRSLQVKEEMYRRGAEALLASGDQVGANKMMRGQAGVINRMDAVSRAHSQGILQTRQGSMGGAGVMGTVGLIGSSMMGLGAGLAATLGPLALLGVAAYAAADGLAKEQEIRDAQAKNRTELTSFVESLDTASQWIQAQTGGGSKWKNTPEFTAAFGQDRRIGSLVGTIIEDISEKGTKDFSQADFAKAFNKRLRGASANIGDLANQYGMDETTKGQLNSKILLAAYQAEQAFGGTARFKGDIGRTVYGGYDSPGMDPELRARANSGLVTGFRNSAVGNAFNLASGALTSNRERMARLRELVPQRDAAKKDVDTWKAKADDLWFLDWKDLEDVAGKPGQEPSFMQSIRGLDRPIDAIRKYNTLQNEVNNLSAQVSPKDMASLFDLSVDGMATTLVSQLGKGASLKDVVASLSDLSAEIRTMALIATSNGLLTTMLNDPSKIDSSLSNMNLLDAMKNAFLGKTK